MTVHKRFELVALLLVAVLIAGCGGSGSNRPNVTATSPNDAATGVGTNAVVSVTFDDELDPATVTTSSFTLTGGMTGVVGTVQAAGRTAIFTPSSALAPNTLYTAVITNAVTNQDGHRLRFDKTWSFTTGAVAVNQTAVNLGTSATFGVLAGTSVLNTGATTVAGDVGVSPGTTATGFPPGTFTGTLHAGDATAATAQTDLTTAYLAVSGLTAGATNVAGNLGGLTLGPGLYTATSSLSVSDQDLTLDAGGNAAAVFIFRTDSTLTISSGRQVLLTNGATAANVFWRIGNEVVLRNNSILVGTILANGSITMESGATLNGRALARTGSVTLNANTITAP